MKNKVVLITGASSGIGKSCAELFANKGSKVVLAARNITQLDIIVEKLKAKGCDISAIKSDVSIEKDCQLLVQQTIEKYGQLDVLVNNAGISMRATLEDVDLDVVKKVMDVNFYGMVYCTKYALPHLLQSKGSIVGVSSIAGYKGLPARCGYSASKFAMNGFLESLRIENLKKDLHVLIACPGFTSSNIRNTALNSEGSAQSESPRDEKNMMTSDEVSNRIYNATLRRQNSIVLTVNGKLTVFLNKLFPKLVDKLIYKHLKKEPNSPF